MILLAETTPALPDPNLFSSIGWVCVILVSVIIGLRQGMAFIRELREKPNGAEALKEAYEKFATKEQVGSLISEIEKVNTDLQAYKTTIIENGETRKNFIIGHIDDMRSEVQVRIDDTHRRIDNIPSQIIAMMSNLNRKL